MPDKQHYEEFVFNISSGSELVRETLEGRNYFVIPTVGIREGVWAGNQGPIFYSSREIGKAPSNWDHKPAVVQHPKKKGKAFTAADKEMIDKYRTGILLSSALVNNKLVFKTWIDEERIKTLSPKTYTRIQNKEKVEVSTGMLMEVEEKKGVYNGKPYIGIARNIQPDHLAILPDTVGACSVKDGAGLFATNESGAVIDPTQLFNLLESIDEEPRQKVKEIINQWMAENELSYTAIQRALNEALASKFGEKGKYWNGYVRDLFQDRVIFYDGSDGSKLYQMTYSVNEDRITLNGERKEVQAVVQYQPTTNEVVKMPIDIKRVAAVIANKNSTYSEEDKDFLTNLDEKQFVKIEGILQKAVVTNEDPEDEDETEDTPNKKVKKKKATALSLSDTLKDLDPKVRRVIENGLKADAKERDRCIGIITSQKNCPFKPEVLKSEDLFSTETLQGMAELIENERKSAKSKKVEEDYETEEFVENEEEPDNEDPPVHIGKATGGKEKVQTVNESELALPPAIDFKKASKG